MNEADLRRKFEVWATAGGFNTSLMLHAAYPPGTYADSRTHAAWEACKAFSKPASDVHQSINRRHAERLLHDCLEQYELLGYERGIEEGKLLTAIETPPVAWLARDGAGHLFIINGNGPHDVYGGFPVYNYPRRD